MLRNSKVMHFYTYFYNRKLSSKKLRYKIKELGLGETVTDCVSVCLPLQLSLIQLMIVSYDFQLTWLGVVNYVKKLSGSLCDGPRGFCLSLP